MNEEFYRNIEEMTKMLLVDKIPLKLGNLEIRIFFIKRYGKFWADIYGIHDKRPTIKEVMKRTSGYVKYDYCRSRLVDFVSSPLQNYGGLY